MRFFVLLQRLLPPVWFGITGAIALESWLKFRAPGITLPLGLGIGKLVFTTINPIEITIAVILAAAIFIAKTTTLARALFVIISLILAFQTFVLMPALITRIDAIVAGNPPPDSPVHLYYIVCEMTKLALLLLLSAVMLWPRKEVE